MSYYFIYPVTDGNLTNTIQEKKRLSDDIQKTKQSNNSLKISISTTNSQIKTGNKVIESLTYSKEELEQLVKQLTFLRFDLGKWVSLYKDIPTLSKKHHLMVVQLDNTLFLDGGSKTKKTEDKKTKVKTKQKLKETKTTKNNELVDKKMEITLNVIGDFVDFVKFLNSFENRKEFVKVQKIAITGQQMIVTIEIYGAKL